MRLTGQPEQIVFVAGGNGNRADRSDSRRDLYEAEIFLGSGLGATVAAHPVTEVAWIDGNSSWRRGSLCSVR